MIAGAGDVLICSHIINLAKWKSLGEGFFLFVSFFFFFHSNELLYFEIILAVQIAPCK